VLKLTFRSGPREGETLDVTGKRFVVGRDPGCDLVLDDPKVSRQHAAFVLVGDGRVLLGDLGSSNGTFVDGKRLKSSRELRGGERVRFGATVVETRAVSGPVHPPEDTARTVVGGEAPGADRERGSRGDGRGARGRLRGWLGGRTALLAGGLAVIAAVAAGAVVVTGGEGGGSVQRTSGLAAAVDSAVDATVLVRTRVDGRVTASASGWVLDAAQSLVVTSAHAIAVQRAPGRLTFAVRVGERERGASLAGMSPCDDLAVLRTSGDDLRTLPGTDAPRRPEVGATVVAAGHPGALRGPGNVVTTQARIVAAGGPAPRRSAEVAPLEDTLQLAVQSAPGSSGGPVVDAAGRGVGTVALSGVERGEARTYAVALASTRSVLTTLAGGRSRAWTGAALGPIAPAAGRAGGMFLTAAVPGSAAARALPPGRGWLLERVGGRRVGATVASYCRALGGRSSGERAVLTVRPAAPAGGTWRADTSAQSRHVRLELE